MSGDGEWIVACIPDSDPERHSRFVAYPRKGGSPIELCNECSVRWTRDGRHLLFVFGPGQAMARPKTYVIALPAGRAFPSLPAGGIQSEADLVRLGVVAEIPDIAGVFPGPDRSVYAFTRTTVHRNLYRIPLR